MWGESDPIGVGWGLRFCIPYQLPADADAGGVRTILGVAGSGDPLGVPHLHQAHCTPLMPTLLSPHRPPGSSQFP